MDVDSGSESETEDTAVHLVRKRCEYKQYLNDNPIQIKTPVQIPKNTHKYDTRLAQRRRSDEQYVRNINQKLIPVFPDDKHASKKRSVNAKVIQNKPSLPVYNKHLLDSITLPIEDRYDINNLSDAIIKSKQTIDPLLFPITEFCNNNNKSAVLQSSVLDWAHTNMHHGGARMLSGIISRFWWIGLRGDIALYTKCCDGCQSVKSNNSKSFKSGELSTFAACETFELISIDIVGPLRTTTNGNLVDFV
eukprot:312394_1